VTNPVQQAMALITAQEQRRERATLTAAVATKLGVSLGIGDRSEWPTWEAWCSAQGTEACPALPAAVAVYIMAHAALGIDRLEKIVASISAVHVNVAHVADPCLSPLVSAALNQVAPIEAPHSFPGAQKAQFMQLPRPLQKFVAEHTRKIVAEMRRAQNAAAITKRKEPNNGNSKDSTAATASVA
jgi:hypothetical protein